MANEKRLIDANALSESVSGIGKDIKRPRAVELACLCLIAEAPTVDAVEVVRCKDCKHWHEETGWCYHHSHFIGAKGEACHPWESNDWKMFDADDFCSYGERRTDA